MALYQWRRGQQATLIGLQIQVLNAAPAARSMRPAPPDTRMQGNGVPARNSLVHLQGCLQLQGRGKKGPAYGVRPWSWTGSRGGFDPLPGVVILELRRAQVAERGV